MNSIIKLIINYKYSPDDELFEEISRIFDKLIQHHTKYLSDYFKEDMYQELLLSLLNVIRIFEMKNNIIDYKWFTMEKLLEIEKNKFKDIEKAVDIKYINGFIKQYGDELFIESFDSDVAKNRLLYEFCLFCNENQFIKYLNKTFKTRIALFYRKNKEEFDANVISLNSPIDENKELLDEIPDIQEDDKSPFDKYDFTRDEIEFLNDFIEEGTVLTEAEVAKKLGKSQQAVNKKKNRLVKKYKKK